VAEALGNEEILSGMLRDVVWLETDDAKDIFSSLLFKKEKHIIFEMIFFLEN